MKVLMTTKTENQNTLVELLLVMLWADQLILKVQKKDFKSIVKVGLSQKVY